MSHRFDRSVSKRTLKPIFTQHIHIPTDRHTNNTLLSWSLNWTHINLNTGFFFVCLDENKFRRKTQQCKFRMCMFFSTFLRLFDSLAFFFFFIITCATNERRLPSIFFFNTVHSIMTWNTTENHMPFLHTLQAHKSHRIIVDKSLNMGTSATAINSCVNDFELVGFFFTLSLSLFSWVITVFLRPIKCVSVVMCCSVFFSLLTWRKNDW